MQGANHLVPGYSFPDLQMFVFLGFVDVALLQCTYSREGGNSIRSPMPMQGPSALDLLHPN